VPKFAWWISNNVESLKDKEIYGIETFFLYKEFRVQNFFDTEVLNSTQITI